MKAREWVEKLKVTPKKRKGLLIAVLVINLIWIVTIFAIYDIEKKNIDRYQVQNYERFEKNTEAFLRVISETDVLCQDMTTSQDALPFFETCSREALEALLERPDAREAEESDLFVKDSLGRKLVWRLSSMVDFNRDFVDVALYNPQTGNGIALLSDGQRSVLCAGAEELAQLIGIDADFETAPDGALLGSQPEGYALAQLYVVRRMEDGLLLLCGLDDAAWRDTLLTNSCGRSYQLEQMVLELADGKRYYQEEGKTLADMGIDEQALEAGKPFQRAGSYTVMSFAIENPRCRWMAVLTESGATSVVSSTWFYLVLLLNALWLLVVAGIGVYMLIRVFNPLKRISANVPAGSADSGADEMDKIAQALEHYHEQLSSSQMTIDSQEEMLRRACLRQMALEQTLSVTPEQLERLGIPQLLRRYILITLYPDDGYWTPEQYSAQENDYRRHVTVTAVQQMIRAQMQENVDVQFVMFQSCLLMVIPVGEDAPEAELRQAVEHGVVRIGAQMGKRFRFGISRVRMGQESFARAYREAMLHAALVEEKESGRSEDISLNMLLKQNMHMADLVYMEQYNSAFACFKEMVETLFKQKSRHLRNRQLSSLLSLTLCMLTETNKTNTLLLEQMNTDASELLKLEDEPELLQKWEKVFVQLEENKNKQLHGQYSEQFASIYQYMHAHFRDQELSLSLLAEKYNMSVSTLSREFQKNLGQGFLECLHQMRIDAARYEIEHTNTSLSDIAVAVGYTNTLTMTRAFKKYLGCTPSAFRKKENSI